MTWGQYWGWCSAAALALFVADDAVGRPLGTIHRLKLYAALQKKCDLAYGDAHKCDTKTVEALILSNADIGHISLLDIARLPRHKLEQRITESEANRQRVMRDLYNRPGWASFLTRLNRPHMKMPIS
jgi:hypothetical protein